MDFFWAIGFQTAQYSTLIFGIFGITFSFILLISPALTTSLSNVFNNYIDVDDKIAILDKGIQIDDFFYTHHFSIGICLIAGSLFSLIFFLFEMNMSGFANIFFAMGKSSIVIELSFLFFSWILKISCVIGFVMGIMLVLAPGKVREFEKKMNSWFETQTLVSKLNSPARMIDAYFFKYHIVFGMVGLLVSAFVLITSILNFL
jgi:hypothetical protein